MAKSVSLLASTSHIIKSQSTGKDYEITVALPYAYIHDPVGGGPFYESLAAWPVVYLTDGNRRMGVVTDFVRELAWCRRTVDAIVVGIGYPQGSTPQETWRITSQLRSDDLTPVRIEKEEMAASASLRRQVKTGGGRKFLSFLKQELIPWVEQEYRADPARRILVGHSYGGMFTLYAMFQEPGLFRSYIAVSPYLKDPERSIFQMEREFEEKKQDLKAQLYLAAGELEESAEGTTLTDMYRLAALLEGRHYPGLELTRQVWPDSNHCEVAGPAFHAGLRIALKS